MSENENTNQGSENEEKKTPEFESTLTPGAADFGGEASGRDEFELDLEVDDIETRLPYGSEDIADK